MDLWDLGRLGTDDQRFRAPGEFRRLWPIVPIFRLQSSLIPTTSLSLFPICKSPAPSLSEPQPGGPFPLPPLKLLPNPAAVLKSGPPLSIVKTVLCALISS